MTLQLGARRVVVAEDRLRHAAEAVEVAVSGGRYPTCVVKIANSDGLLWTHVAPGVDDAAEDSVFAIASISKPITATALMRLVEQGKLLLTEPISKFLPEFGANGKQDVTAAQLLTHTSGIEEEELWDPLRQMGADHAAVFDAACNSWLHFAPGERCAYNTISFTVLGELISRVSGLAYPEYLQRHVFGPLGMTSTAFTPLDPSRTMPVHSVEFEGGISAMLKMALPGGGLLSTADDLVAFGRAILRGGTSNGYRLLGRPAVETMTRLQTLGLYKLEEGVRSPFDYGLGWAKPSPTSEQGSLGSVNSFGHGGATGTYLWIDPEWDLVFVLMTNNWADGDDGHRVLNAVYGSLDSEA